MKSAYSFIQLFGDRCAGCVAQHIVQLTILPGDRNELKFANSLAKLDELKTACK